MRLSSVLYLFYAAIPVPLLIPIMYFFYLGTTLPSCLTKDFNEECKIVIVDLENYFFPVVVIMSCHYIILIGLVCLLLHKERQRRLRGYDPLGHNYSSSDSSSRELR